MNSSFWLGFSLASGTSDDGRTQRDRAEHLAAVVGRLAERDLVGDPIVWGDRDWILLFRSAQSIDEIASALRACTNSASDRFVVARVDGTQVRTGGPVAWPAALQTFFTQTEEQAAAARAIVSSRVKGH